MRHTAGASIGPTLTIVGNAGRLNRPFSNAPSTTGWTRYAGRLLAGKGWDFSGDFSLGSPATQQNITDVLADVLAVVVYTDLDVGATGGTAQMDNVRFLEPQQDVDSDDVPNGEDACPTAAGPLSNSGCPVPPPTVRCNGVLATKVGTGASEVLVGTSGCDIIAGLGGGDSIRGLGGGDIICGGNGPDIVIAGKGNDEVKGGGGGDTINGGPAGTS